MFNLFNLPSKDFSSYAFPKLWVCRVPVSEPLGSTPWLQQHSICNLFLGHPVQFQAERTNIVCPESIRFFKARGFEWMKCSVPLTSLRYGEPWVWWRGHMQQSWSSSCKLHLAHLNIHRTWQHQLPPSWSLTGTTRLWSFRYFLKARHYVKDKESPEMSGKGTMDPGIEYLIQNMVVKIN